MKLLQVKLFSAETVKPSSPTPHHLNSYQLSFLDQISPPIYVPLLLFFTDGPTDAKLTTIKKSLSNTLTHFYPLAGRIGDGSFIDCNDAGVPFKLAKADYCLHEFLCGPVPAELDKLLPCKPDDFTTNTSILDIQATMFSCGGIALGLCFSHKAGDAFSLAIFLKAWSAAARGKKNIPPPRFESATLFPPKNLSGYKHRVGITKDNINTKRFVFDTTTIESLRRTTSGNSILSKRPTRVEALSAFIWSRFMAATTTASEEHEDDKLIPKRKLHLVQHTVNIRRRMDPPLPENSFGNYYRLAVTIPSSELKNNKVKGNDRYHGLVGAIRCAIGKIDGEYMRRVREGDEHLKFVNERAERATKGESESFTFSSLCRFPIYETDFGWGKPVWVASARTPFKNLVSFLDSRSGEGIEAWINLKEEDMAKLEKDEEFSLIASRCTRSVV